MICLGVNNDLLEIVISDTRDGQALVQIIPANKFKKYIVTNEMMLDDAQNEVWPTTE